MESNFNLDYRWKDIFITLLPGFFMILLIVILFTFNGILDEEIWDKLLIKELSAFLSIILILLCILIGVLVNNIASVCSRFCMNKGLIKRPNADKYNPHNNCYFKNRITANKTAHTMHREALDHLDPDSKIEEYFVHFAMSRNLYYAQLIAILLQIFTINSFLLQQKISTFVWCLVAQIVIIIIQYRTYRHHWKRYEEIIESKYN